MVGLGGRHGDTSSVLVETVTKKKSRFKVPFKMLSELSQKYIVEYTKSRIDRKEPRNAQSACRWEQMKKYGLKPAHAFVSQKKALRGE